VDDSPREQYLVHIPYAAAALSYYVYILVIRRARLSSRFEEIGREAPRSSNKMFAKGERAQVLIMILAVCVCVHAYQQLHRRLWHQSVSLRTTHDVGVCARRK
jgi:hypothetical protein